MTQRHVIGGIQAQTVADLRAKQDVGDHECS